MINVIKPSSVQSHRVAALYGSDVVNRIQTHNRFKRTLSIRTTRNTRIVGVIPFIKLQNDT